MAEKNDSGSGQIVVMTGDQLKGFAADIAREILAAVKQTPHPPQQRQDEFDEEEEEVIYFPPKGREYVFGLRGICNLFNVSHTTAQRYKDTFLKPAVLQNGRKIAIDVEMARELFTKHQSE